MALQEEQPEAGAGAPEVLPTFTGLPLPASIGDVAVAPAGIPGQGNQQGLTEAQARQQVLNRIAYGEANSYNELYGGHQFNSFDDHPRVGVPITSGPNAGKTSTAAGRYQFLASTWDDEKARLGLSDFSPGSQDAAAWDLADRTYRGQTGRSLLADAQAGKVEWGALGGQWESLRGAGAGPGMVKGSWSGRSWDGAQGQEQGQAAGQGQSAGSSAAPADPLLQGLARLHLLQSVFPQHSFTPVAYDPWKYVPKG